MRWCTGSRSGARILRRSSTDLIPRSERSEPRSLILVRAKRARNGRCRSPGQPFDRLRMRLVAVARRVAYDLTLRSKRSEPRSLILRCERSEPRSLILRCERSEPRRSGRCRSPGQPFDRLRMRLVAVARRVAYDLIPKCEHSEPRSLILRCERSEPRRTGGQRGSTRVGRL
jgi:hypothetical protein